MNERKEIYGAIFFTSLSLLVFEVGLTRIFSVMFWYHFAYIIIGLCLLGLGAAGSYLAIINLPARQQRSRVGGQHERTQVQAAPAFIYRVSFLYPLSFIVCFLLSTRLNFAPLQLLKEPVNIAKLFIIYLLLVVPFFLGGVCLGFLISFYKERISRLYFFDLLGAAVGAALITLGLNPTLVGLNGVAALMLGVLAAALANLFFARLVRVKSYVPTYVLLLVVLQAMVFFTLEEWRIQTPPSKELYPWQDDVEYTKWNAIARIDVVKEWWLVPHFGGDISPLFMDKAYQTHPITQDGTAPTLLYRIDKGDVSLAEQLPFLAGTTQAAAYQVLENPKVLVIGTGGGVDVLAALYHQARQITAVELNPIMIELITSKYHNYTNGIFLSPTIIWVANEGRHFLASSQEQYDLIQMSGVDTLAALSSGAYVLSENYLYTKESIKDIYQRLTPDGIYNVARPYFVPPREVLRLVVIMTEALQESGLSEPEKHLVVLKGDYWGSVLMRKRPWQIQEMAAIREFVQHYQFDFFYDPFIEQNNHFNQYLRANAKGRRQFIKNYPLAIDAVTDDRPFFFQYYKWREALKFHSSYGDDKYGSKPIFQLPMAHWTLLISLAQLVLLSSLLILLPLLRLKGSLNLREGRWRFLLYFSALGLGFIFTEVILIQKFIVYLGQPMYSLSLVLAALLAFSGLGSYLTSGFHSELSKTLKKILLLLILMVIIQNYFIGFVLHATLKIPYGWKLLVSLLLILPLGLLLGMPFPMGIKLASGEKERLIPWLWGVNACFTVLGAMLCIFLSTFWGFKVVFFIAAGLYFLAFLCMAYRSESYQI